MVLFYNYLLLALTLECFNKDTLYLFHQRYFSQYIDMYDKVFKKKKKNNRSY